MALKRQFRRVGVSLGLLAAGGSTGVPACCAVAPSGKPVAFGDQTNIVIWNPATHMEHFVRDAKFQSDAANFGFIAPSPSKPDLSEASSEAFTTLAALQPEPSHWGCNKSDDTVGAAAADTKSIRVVQEKDVAGYHATTLLASDSTALAAWMVKNGYQTTPAIKAWTKVYIAKGWFLTAFKVRGKGEDSSTGTLRMSFKTDKPFNPYFVPRDNIKADQTGTLKLYFVSNENYRATIGATEAWQNPLWDAAIPSDSAGRLAEQLKLSTGEMPANAQVQAFVDTDFPRPASDDIYFTPNPNRHLGAFAALLVTGAAIGVFLHRRRTRRV